MEERFNFVTKEEINTVLEAEWQLKTEDVHLLREEEKEEN